MNYIARISGVLYNSEQRDQCFYLLYGYGQQNTLFVRCHFIFFELGVY